MLALVGYAGSDGGHQLDQHKQHDLAAYLLQHNTVVLLASLPAVRTTFPYIKNTKYFTREIPLVVTGLSHKDECRKDAFQVTHVRAVRR